MTCSCFGDAEDAWADAPVVLTVGLQVRAVATQQGQPVMFD